MHMGCGVATTVRLTGGNHVGRMPLALEQALAVRLWLRRRPYNYTLI